MFQYNLNSYFEKLSSENWIEFRDDRFSNEFEEVNQKFYAQTGLLEITLRRWSDDLFVKLTNDTTYYSWDKSKINTFLATGFWSSQPKKSEGIN